MENYQGFHQVYQHSTPYFHQNQHTSLKNKYVFVKPNVQSVAKSTSVLVNPHFKEASTKVFINPNFQQNLSNFRIHVNPNVIKCTQNVQDTALQENKLRFHEKTHENEQKVLISTKNKLVKVPQKCDSNSLNSALKKVETNTISISKYKFVKSVKNNNDNSRTRTIKSRHKIVNKRTSDVNISKPKTLTSPASSNISKKKFVYVNKFASTSFLANKVILRNSRKNSLININGIMYQKTASMLKKAQGIRSQNVKLSTSPPSRKRTISVIKNGNYKLTRRKICLTKLKKSNVPCAVYKKFGQCPGQKKGTCIKIHNPDQVTLCPKFLQGRCLKKKCLLSHKVSAEKMPTCKYYLEGLCSREDCQYLHVKINPKSEICREFLQGYCVAGKTCTKRHQFLCPDFEKNQKCPRKKCEYPHVKVQTTTRIQKESGKKSIKKQKKPDELSEVSKEEKLKSRYYQEVEIVEEALITERPKLGTLPSFIPLKNEVSNNK